MEENIHGTAEQFEAYALGRLSDSEEQVLDEHLLICTSCRNALDQTILYVSAMRETLRDAGRDIDAKRDWFAWLRPAFTPRFAFGGAFAGLVVALGLYFGLSDHVRYSPVVALELAAVRGDSPAIAPTRELDLTLGSFPSAGGPFKVEIVDANGGGLWSGAVTSPAVQVHDKFRPGVYFVRLYGANGNLLHEYGFRVEAGQ